MRIDNAEFTISHCQLSIINCQFSQIPFLVLFSISCAVLFCRLKINP